MPTYLLCMKLNAAAMKGAAPKDADAAAKMLAEIPQALGEKLPLFNGGVVKTYWVLGEFDVVAIVEADSDVAVAGVALWLAQTQHVSTTTMRAYDDNDVGIPGDDKAVGRKQPSTNTVAGVLYRCHADQGQ